MLARLGIAPTAVLASASSSAAAAGGAAAAVVPDHHHQGLSVLLRKGADAARDAVSGAVIAATASSRTVLDQCCVPDALCSLPLAS